MQSYAFQPQQQFRYTMGKNATDSAMIIDAMGLLQSGRIDGCCIVSSDDDFTRLATCVREHGLFVMGSGKPRTPKAFVNAWDVFVPATNLAAEQKSREPAGENNNWTKVVRQAISAAARDDGWAFLGAVGSLVRETGPAFDSRSFGHRQLSGLVKSKPEVFRTRMSKNEYGATAIDVKVAD